jgi:hypothetical protein
VLASIASPELFWILVLEDDVKFHPCFTQELFSSYLQKIPESAGIVKFGYLATPDYQVRYSAENTHYVSFGTIPSFATHCYAVKSTHLRHLLNIRFNKALDCVPWPATFGAVNPERLLSVPDDLEWRMYYNPYTKKKEPYHGLVACTEQVSATFC